MNEVGHQQQQHKHTHTVHSTDYRSSSTGSQQIATPLTPTHAQMDLPTPPTSNVELSYSTRPPSAQKSAGKSQGAIDKTDANSLHTEHRSPSPATSHETTGIDQSPSIVAHQRKTKRISAGAAQSSDILTDVVAGRSTNGDGVVVEGRPSAQTDEGNDHRARSSSPLHPDASDEAGPSSARSRTPSPILGSVLASSGRLSFSASLQPSAEEVRTLLYGDQASEDEEMARPRSVNHTEMEELLQKVDSMGLSSEEQSIHVAGTSREKDLASMVKKLVSHAKKQDAFIDSMEAALHNTRLRSIAMLSSVRTSFAHSFATEYELRARLQAELDGTKVQARKLSQLLARSETRNEEVERERAASAEEEVMWQEEMKDHASAYARQQAVRARAAQLAQRSQRNNASAMDTPKKEHPTTTSLDAPDGTIAPAEAGEDDAVVEAPGTQPLATGLDEPFEERKPTTAASTVHLPQSHSDGSITGLGISSTSHAATVQIDAPAGSPLSTIIKERNKLLADKRYLKTRVRDAEAQRDRLELELKSLRPLLVRGVPTKGAVASQLTATPTTPGRSQKRDRSRRRRQAVMGDAEAEHLLLAARRLQNTRKASDDDRPTTPPPAHASTNGTHNPRTPKTPRISQTPRSSAVTDSVTMQSGASAARTPGDARMNAPDASPLARRSATTLGRWGTHQRVDSNRSAGGIDDLLQAAQTVLTPGERIRQGQTLPDNGEADGVNGEAGYTAHDSSEGDDDERADVERVGGSRRKDHALLASSIDDSPKRRRVSSAAPGHERRHSFFSMSPDKTHAFVGSQPRRTRNQTEGAEPQLSMGGSSGDAHADSLPLASQASALSALDLLADQAAASQVPSQSSDRSHSGEGEAFGGGGRSDDDSDDGMHVDHVGPNGTPQMAHAGAHYYPRNAYGHMYATGNGAPVAGPPHHGPLGHDGYRMAANANVAPGYAYGPGGSPVTLSSHGWTSQNVPNGRNGGIYSPPTAHQHARFLQSGPRISSGFVANMQEGSRLAKSHQGTPRMMNGNGMANGVDAMYDEEDEMDHANGGGQQGQQRTPQKGGNTSPDKRLPYVRWSEEEDQKLRKAIGEFGQRWESVARTVGTRTYHQCRQRYLLMRRKEAAARDGGGLGAGGGDDSS